MADEAEETRGRPATSRRFRMLLAVVVFVPLGVLAAAVAGVNLFLLASELVKLVSW
ncbi:MAG TPA: hypothetical protein VL244_14860 [Alphaproteobacteria bacterium]|nr:hypothetical protein [Alphaproteobacteria bacterium]